MNQFDKKMRNIAKKEQEEMPDSVKIEVETILKGLPEKKVKGKRLQFVPRVAIGTVCVLLLTLFLLPNISPVYAQAMERIPVIGEFVKVITIRNYFYSDEYHEMDIKVPKIESDSDADKEAIEKINEDVDELTKKLMKHFYDTVEFVGNEGHGSIYVDYETITNTKDWFTLKLTVHEESGSGNTYFKYYHVDKRTGEIIGLSDLFIDSSYKEVLEKEIKRQMKLQMEEDEAIVFWIDDEVLGNCLELDGEHNYYFNADGNIVIPFDKYEVAPGAMGCPEIVIDKSIYSDLLNREAP